MHNGKWILISNKMEQTFISGGRKTSRYILVGSIVDKPPLITDNETLSIPANIVNRVISRSLSIEDPVSVVLEPQGRGHYLIHFPREKRNIVGSVLDEVLGNK